MKRIDLHDEIAAVSELCRCLGFGEVAPTVLKAAHHTTFLISPLKIVARVQSAGPVEAAFSRASKETAVARHLADHGAPVLEPLAGPHVADASVITFWPLVGKARSADQADADVGAATLASVHRALQSYRDPLPAYTEALDRCRDVWANDSAMTALSSNDRSLLATQYRRLRGEVQGDADRWVPLHGDSHLGNLLIGERGPVWLDFEEACLGPREYDVACLPPAAWQLFDDVDQRLVGRYADLKSVCVAIWCWADVARSPEIREAAEYHLERVRDFAA